MTQAALLRAAMTGAPDRSALRRPAVIAFGLGLSLGLLIAAPGHACTAVAPQIDLCPQGPAMEGLRGQDIDGVMVWESAAYWVEFNPALTAATPPGPLPDALDGLLALALADAAGAEVRTLRRDSLTTAAATVERLVMEVGPEGQTTLAALMLADMHDGGARLAWSVGSRGPSTLDAILALTEATAAGLRPGSEN